MDMPARYTIIGMIYLVVFGPIVYCLIETREAANYLGLPYNYNVDQALSVLAIFVVLCIYVCIKASTEMWLDDKVPFKQALLAPIDLIKQSLGRY